MFPPIEEQTERDSESQRYPEEQQVRFGGGMGGRLRQEMEEREMWEAREEEEKMHMAVFASFAKQEHSDMKRYEQSNGEFNMLAGSFNPAAHNTNLASPHHH